MIILNYINYLLSIIQYGFKYFINKGGINYLSKKKNIKLNAY